MKDVQSQKDHRRIDIQKVGVKNVQYPVVVLDKRNRTQSTVATINLYADLPHDFKGTHMSRFIEVVNQYYVDISMNSFLQMLDKIRHLLDASRAYGEVFFPYFIEKRAPVSGAKSLMEYTCSFSGTLAEDFDFVLGVRIPVHRPAFGERRRNERPAVTREVAPDFLGDKRHEGIEEP